MKLLLLMLCLFVGFGAHASKSPLELKIEAKSFATSIKSRAHFRQFVMGWQDQKDIAGPLSFDDEYDMFVKYFVEYVGKVFGEEVAKVILEASGIPAIKLHVIDLYEHVNGMLDPDTCIDNAPKAFEDFVFIAVAAGIIAYQPGSALVAIQVADAAGKVGKFVFLQVGADYKICALIE